MTGLSGLADEYDVLVAGGGGAGLMAALEAAERGASVLLVEKQPELGGTTAMAVGTLSASGTPQQAAAGIEDDVDSHYRDYLKFIPPGGSQEDYDLELTRLLVERAPEALARLMELGVEFSGPHPEPPHTVYRMHNVLPDSDVYIDVLSRAAEAHGAAIRTETAIQELHRAAGGPVVGVVLRSTLGGGTREIRVRRGVVLAMGYFAANDEMARAHGRPEEASGVEPLFEAATGDGVALATAVGAATAGMRADGPPNFRTVDRPYIHPGAELFQAGAVLINRDGCRYANELDAPGLATSVQPGKTAYIVFDSRLIAQVATPDQDSAKARDGWLLNDRLFLSTFPAIGYAYLEDYRQRTEYFHEAGSLRDLANLIEVPEQAFEEEIRELNRKASADGSDPFGRDPIGPGVSEAPFYALGPIKALNGTSGGASR